MSTLAIEAGAIERLAASVLTRAGATPANAGPVARAIARAEAEQNPVCGLFYLPIFAGQLKVGKVDGRAEPKLAVAGAAITVDAGHGFAHPAIEAALPELAGTAKRLGVAAASVSRSTNCLALAHHVTPLAARGLIGLVASNAPASVAPPGATARLFGTNPLAFAVPVADGPPIVVDQSLSAVTKTAIIMRRDRGEAIPEGWAQDGAGRPTRDPAVGLAGSLLPSGGQKGANLALFVEILAAALGGAELSVTASPFGDNEGGPPGVGQFLLAIDPHRFGSGFGARIARLAAAFAEAGVRLPGHRVLTDDPAGWPDTPVAVDAALWARCQALRDG